MGHVDPVNEVEGFNAFGQSGGDNERHVGFGRALARAAAFDIAVVVLHEDGVVIEALEPAAAKKVREAVGALFKLGVRYGYTGLRHDERRLISSNFGMHTWIHSDVAP